MNNPRYENSERLIGTDIAGEETVDLDDTQALLHEGHALGPGGQARPVFWLRLDRLELVGWLWGWLSERLTGECTNNETTHVR